MDYEFKKRIVEGIITIMQEGKTVSLLRLSAVTGYDILELYDCVGYISRADEILTKIHKDGTLL